ncbi:MAG: histidinol-phosphate transaminase [Synergistota bacterium]|nr:histidinol-phosphate transaminase [Synergistota bacterium]
MPFSPRRELSGARAAYHGGLDYEQLRSEGVDPQAVLDFSVSVNSMPPHPEVLNAVARAALARYPDSSSGGLRRKISEVTGLPADCILVTNGLAQAIYLIAFAFCDRGDTALAASPAFGEYEVASRLAGAEFVPVPALEEEGFAFPAERLLSEVRNRRPSLVWVCSPNNPTGAIPSGAEAEALLAACEEEGALLLLDEAYVNFAPSGASLVHLLPSPNLLIMRSMTKDYGLTGLRLGYVAGDRGLIGHLAALQPPWSVNSCAQEAGAEALRREDFYEAQWREVIRLTGRLAEGIRRAGYETLPPNANFVLFKAGDTEALKEFLWRDRILVRDCTSFGLPGYVRVGVRAEPENDLLVLKLGEFRRRGRWEG